MTVRRGGYGVQPDLHAGRTATDFRDQRRIARGRTRTIRHLGDGAFSERAVVSGHAFNDLWVRVGTVNFRVEALRDFGAKPLTRLAKIVLSRLTPTGSELSSTVGGAKSRLGSAGRPVGAGRASGTRGRAAH